MFVRSKILPPPSKFARVTTARLFVSLVCLLWMVSGSVTEAEITYDPNGSNKNITINGETLSQFTIGGQAENGNAYNNHLLINDANFTDENELYYIYGGYSRRENAYDNTVDIQNLNNTNKRIWIFGGMGTTEAKRNIVTFNGGNVDSIIGGEVNNSTSTNDSTFNTSNNTININGGTITGSIEAGSTCVNFTGETFIANDNVVNIRNNPVLDGANIIGYDDYKTSQGTTVSTIHSGNALNIYTKDLTAKNIYNFDLINFHLPDGIKNNDTVLTLTGGSATDISGAAVTAYVPGNNALNDGDTVNLLVNNSGITDTNTTYNGTLEEGVSFSHKIEVKKTNDNTVALVVGEPTTTPVVTPTSGGETTPTTPTTPTEKRLNAQTSILPAPMLAAPAIVSRHIDSTINWLPPQDNFWSEDKGKGNANDLTTTDPVNKPGWSIFANMSGSVMHTKTGNGSNMDTRSGGLDIGAARAFVGDNSTTYVAPLVDYGGGSYDSYLSDGTHGNGKTKFFMGGFIARHAFNNGFYYEGSFRYGRATMDFFSNDPKMMFNGQPEKYDTSAPCWAGHINVGKRLKIDPYNALDVYAIYFHTHQNGMEADLASGETYRFDAVTNYRLRTGARLTRYTSDHSRFYSGIAYEYTHDGAARGTYLARGLSTEEIGGSGSSVMLELGYQLKPNKNNPWMLDVAAVGWAGHQRGFSIQAKMKKEF